MDATFLILLLALFLTWLAWLAARQKTRMAAAEAVAQQQRNSYSLEEWDDGHARGFHVIGPDGERLTPGELDWTEHGLMAAEVMAMPGPSTDAGSGDVDAGGSDAAGGRDDFTAGASVELIPAEDGQARVEVWNTRMTARAGELHPDIARRVLAFDDDAAVGECVILEEGPADGDHTGLLLLLVRHDMLLDG